MATDPGERVAPTRCDDRPADRVTSGYRLRLELSAGDAEDAPAPRRGLLARARAPGARGRPGGAFPAVFATAEPGWTFSLQLFPERGEALLSGGTPCLPDPRA